jgi:predicted DNA-binding transcriptional regulator AlpA
MQNDLTAFLKEGKRHRTLPGHYSSSGVFKIKTSQTAPAAVPSDSLVKLPKILARYPVSRSSWLAGVKTGRYPKPVKLGPRSVAI